MDIKRISIIVPVYNTADYLEKCLNSLLNQGIDNYEIIIINDGSTDESGTIAKDYAAKYSFIQYFEQKNQGLSATRNVGINKASGNYIYFMDSDDLLEKGSLKELLTLVEKNELDAIFFDAQAFYDLKNVKNNVYNYHRKKSYGFYSSGQELFQDLVNNREFHASACLYIVKTEIIHKNKLSFLNGILHEDELFTVDFMMVTDNCMHINEQYFKRRVRENSIVTSSKNEDKIIGYSVVFIELENIFNSINFSSDRVKRTFEKNMGKIYRTILSLGENVLINEKAEKSVDQVKKIAKKHNFFGVIGYIETVNYPLYNKLRNFKDSLLRVIFR